MNIKDDHLYHGAALTQIAEHPQFTAINSVTEKGNASRSSFLINKGAVVFLKYATAAKGRFAEYKFTFTRQHLNEIEKLSKKYDLVVAALVCVKAREICCLTNDQLVSLIDRRIKEKGDGEDQYQVLVTVPKGKKFRVYLNQPGRRKIILGDELLIARNAFPNALFE